MVAASANFQSIRCVRISFEHITQREFDVLSGVEPPRFQSGSMPG